MDRYRGTEYDPGDWAPNMNTTTLTMPVSKSANRVRTIVVVAFLAVLMTYKDPAGGTDPAKPRKTVAEVLLDTPGVRGLHGDIPL